MPSACQGDELLGQHVEKLVTSRAEVEVGVLIGRNGSRATILSLLSTSQQGNANQPASLQATEDKSSKKQKKAQQDMLVQLDVDAIVDHATQVAAMLPGGISAMGLYFYGPDASFNSAATQLCKALDSMSAGIAEPADKLLTISSQTQKFLCKQRPPGSASTASLAVCDFKLAHCLQSFIPLQCSHHVSMTTPVLASTQALSTHIETAVTAETERIRSSTAVYQGSIPSSSSAVGEIALAPTITLLYPPACQDTTDPSSSQQATVSGRIVLDGMLSGRALVHKKDTWDAAVDMLKADLIASLQARMDIVMAEAENSEGSNNIEDAQHPLLMPAAHAIANVTISLPSQLSFPAHPVDFFDYQAAGESRADVTARIQGLLGHHAQAQARTTESEATALQTSKPLSQWDPSPAQVTTKSRFSGLALACAAAVAIALLAVGIAFLQRR